LRIKVTRGSWRDLALFFNVGAWRKEGNNSAKAPKREKLQYFVSLIFVPTALTGRAAKAVRNSLTSCGKIQDRSLFPVDDQQPLLASLLVFLDEVCDTSKVYCCFFSELENALLPSFAHEGQRVRNAKRRSHRGFSCTRLELEIGDSETRRVGTNVEPAFLFLHGCPTWMCGLYYSPPFLFSDSLISFNLLKP
jgi:hypothetical protein